jgi:hypothetical protein
MLDDEIYTIYRDLLATLPEGTAVLNRRSSTDAGGEDIELIPTNLNSARIYVHPMADWIYVSIGRNTSTELFTGGIREKEDEALTRLKRISRAVIEGNFSEEVWTLGGKIVKSVGTLEINGKVQRLRFTTFFNLMRRKQRKQYVYSPYVATQ